MRYITIIFILFSFGDSFSQSDKHINEEFKAIDDIFIELLDTSRFYYREPLYYSWNSNDLEKYARKPQKYIAYLNYYDSIYFPFKFSETLLNTISCEDFINTFEEIFDEYSDSISNLIDTSILKVFVTNKLFKYRDWDMKSWYELVYPDTLSLTTIPIDTCLPEIEFDFNKIQNKGRYVLSTDNYPSRQLRQTTKNIKEIAILDISRVSFDKENINGVLFYELYMDNLAAEGYVVIIEKINNKWKIKNKLRIWQA